MTLSIESLSRERISALAKPLVIALLATVLSTISPINLSADADAPSSGVAFTTVEGGGEHSLALTADGKLYAWGNNGDGQLGDGGTSYERSSPVSISPELTFKAIAAGKEHSLALTADGTLYRWGRNHFGQLGDGTYDLKNSPVSISGEITFSSIAAGLFYSLALTADGTLYSWGDNGNGQLGDGTYVGTTSPGTTAGGVTFSSIAAGDGHALALTANGTLYAWGGGAYGQLGDGTFAGKNSPTLISSAPAFSAIAAGGGHSLALTADGALYAWGQNDQGQLGTGQTYSSTKSPELIQLPGVRFFDVSAGAQNSFALTVDGAVYAWGRNDSGQLGTGNSSPANSPRLIQAAGVSFFELSAGSDHALAIAADGTLYAWGSDAYGQLGDPRPAFTSTPVSMTSGFRFSTVSAGSAHSLALAADGTLYAWGANRTGQLGLGDTTDRNSPETVSPGVTFSAIAAGEEHSLALTADGTLYAWGDNSNGQIGYGDCCGLEVSPLNISDELGLIVTFSSIATGNQHSLALAADGTLYTWGLNNEGQLGDGTTIRQDSPVSISPDLTFSAIAAGYEYSVALAEDGSIYSWGRNDDGQLGVGQRYSRTMSPELIQIPGISFSAVAVGQGHALALTDDGAIYSWGLNYFGELGIGQSSDSTPLTDSPALIQVPGVSFSSIAAGPAHSLALTDDGSIYSWGANWFGQLAIGSTIDSNTPTLIPAGISLAAISAGEVHTLALGVDGTMYVAGGNFSGQLGVPSLRNSQKTIPTIVEFTRQIVNLSQGPGSDPAPSSSTPSYTGPTLTANNQLVVAGSTVIFSGSKLDLVTAVYVGESLVEITSKTAGSITVRLPATLASGSYDLMMYSSYGRLTVLGAVVVSTASLTDSSNSSIVDLEDLGSNLNLSDAAKLLIGKTKTIPNFSQDQNSLSTKQSAWLKDSLEDSGLTKIVCTGVIMESMSMHQKIQVRKLAKATCVEAAKYLGESSVWYQSKLTTKAAYVRKVMVTFKG